ncbi:MAG: glycoside hydrolase family 97 catalytic domain-containing protein, partial [Bacteroidales bacterium]|nr:glycoside hydrolase family 97 catalytic domain-containing protein [Bacteroidales bacterium]
MKIKYPGCLNKLLATAFLIPFLAVGDVLAQNNVLKSPNGRLSIVFETIVDDQASEEGGQLVYSVTFQDQPLIDRSALSLELQNQKMLGEGVKIISTEKSSFDQSYELIAGKTSVVLDQYNALTLHLRENGVPARQLIIEARAYDDAIAFRYKVPEQSSMQEYRLTGERTEFKISKDAITYAQILPHGILRHESKHSYEAEYVKLPISAFSHEGSVVNDVVIGLPTLMEVPGVAWLAINEADMQGYCTMYLTTLTRAWAGHWLEAVLVPQMEDTSVCVTGTLPLVSPWRILQVGDTPGDLIESNILTSLNPGNVIEDTSWIKPGKAAWNWWSGSIGPDGERDFSTEGMKYYIDFAAASGFEYMLIDAGWAAEDDITKMNGSVDIPGLVEYANQKNVRIWIWVHYRDVVRQMNEAFPIYEEWGVAGLKIDFIERDDQDGIDFYYRVAEKAARHHLMLDFHGSTKPTGLSRTYPNILGYEGVIGMEVSKGSLRDNPDCHLMLPFTRMLQGYMDYTPGGFNNVTKEEFVPRRNKPMVMGTRAHHLAMYVVYESPIQMVSDHPGAYKGEPSFQFIKDVPASWDETKVLNGIPGEYVTIARRK